jgi:hypothetical protein
VGVVGVVGVVGLGFTVALGAAKMKKKKYEEGLRFLKRGEGSINGPRILQIGPHVLLYSVLFFSCTLNSYQIILLYLRPQLISFIFLGLNYKGSQVHGCSMDFDGLMNYAPYFSKFFHVKQQLRISCSCTSEAYQPLKYIDIYTHTHIAFYVRS